MNDMKCDTEDNPVYIAKISDDKREESVYDHSMAVAMLAELFAPSFLKSTTYLTALLHDAGKNCDEFLEYIRKSATDPNSVKRGEVVHSTAGAIIVNEIAGAEKIEIFAAELIRHAILSHHGIYDCTTLEGKNIYRLRSEKQREIEKIRREVFRHIPETELKELFDKSVEELKTVLHMIAEVTQTNEFGVRSFYWGMLERLLLSLLIDADRTASACFEKDIAPDTLPLSTEKLWSDLIELLESHLSEKIETESKIAQLRQEISTACRVAGQIQGQILRLVVPTGGGKTFSSLRYALHQAKAFNKRRIFYIAPFNSILEQNAKEFRTALGNPGIEIVLEHHSNLIADDVEMYDESTQKKYEELTQNWNAPIVLTSAVQFLNTLFSAKSGAVRRMHALADAVIIVDEVQSIPIRCTELFNLAMNFLSGVCGASIVLCSATQPPFEELKDNRLFPPTDMIHDSERYREEFRRTRIIDKTSLIPGGMDVQDAAQFTIDIHKTCSSILFIVNTKKSAKAIYCELKERFKERVSQPAWNLR